jgi:hypothetical protein
VSWWRRRGLWTAAFAVLLVVGLQYAWRNAPLLADWYAGFAAQNLPETASSFAPTHTDDGAYFFCARQVAKRMPGEFSVETFAATNDTETTELGEGKYRISSFVDETREDGRRVRYTFVCTVSYERGRWTLDQLDLNERFATRATGEGPALAARE